ncbi:MAG: helix-turn-helix domain-containing protein [Saprospiraceae bacterium]
MNAIPITLVDADALNERLERIEKAVTKTAKPSTPEPGLMTRNEVGDYFAISKGTLHDWVRKGWLTSYKMGNRTYFKRAEVVAAAQPVNPAA